MYVWNICICSSFTHQRREPGCVSPRWIECIWLPILHKRVNPHWEQETRLLVLPPCLYFMLHPILLDGDIHLVYKSSYVSFLSAFMYYLSLQCIWWKGTDGNGFTLSPIFKLLLSMKSYVSWSFCLLDYKFWIGW